MTKIKTEKLFGTNAGKLWKALNKKGEISATALAKEDHASTEAHLQYCANDLRGLMDEVRTHADSLEVQVADDVWPLAKYQEMLFIK